MISIIITAWKEEKTIGKAIESFLNQDIKEDFEILVVCPDEGTKKIVDLYSKKDKRVIHVQDPGKGKPVALNICFKVAKGDYLILTDGDVYVGDNSVNALMDELKKDNVGAVTGRPVSVNERNSILGYFSHLLTDIGAHDTRRKYVREGKFIVCSGYLFAIRNVINEIRENALSDDAVMSHMIRKMGYRISYAPEARVFVKFPTSFKDWFKQKRRSAGGYNQLKDFFPNHKRMRSFTAEIKEGWYKPFIYPKNFKEFIWTCLLYPIRVYLWLLIFWDLKIKKKDFSKVWVRIESTK